jgi:REP-associated tyrosine transposase
MPTRMNTRDLLGMERTDTQDLWLAPDHASVGTHGGWQPVSVGTHGWRPASVGTHGGWRPGAGRKRGRKVVPHDARPHHVAKHPLHVTLRLCGGAPNISGDWLMKIMRPAIAQSHKPGFRIVEFNVLRNHIHLVVEADDNASLARGMNGFEVRTARRINRRAKRRGKLFATRYHASTLRTPRSVRNVLRYVLMNRKHHAPYTRFDRNWIDPCSSAAWFDGWSAPIRVTTSWKRELVEMAPPTARARSWLLRVGWRQQGLLRFDETPKQ